MLTDYDGNTIALGDTIQYKDSSKRTFKITEIPEHYAKLGMCYGNEFKKRGETHIVIRPRLMKIVKEYEC